MSKMTLMEVIEKLPQYEDGQRFKTSRKGFLKGFDEAYVKTVSLGEVGLFWGTGFPVTVTTTTRDITFVEIDLSDSRTEMNWTDALNRLKNGEKVFIKDGDKFKPVVKDTNLMDVDIQSFNDLLEQVTFYY